MKGREKHVYRDSKGKPTIGVGFNLSRPGARDRMKAVGADYDQVLAGKATLTDEQIDQLLEINVDHAVESGYRVVSNYGELPDEARSIVANMIFQMGEAGVRRFSKFRAALQRRDFGKAADEMLDSKWARSDTPRRARELAARMRALK